MIFDSKCPQDTDPCCYDPFICGWHESKQPGAYYCWAQPVAREVSFHAKYPPVVIELGTTSFFLYFGVNKQELLYRIVFHVEPKRRLIKPSPYCMFWTYGDVGGASRSVEYHYRDRYMTLNEWVDKGSFLAVLRQPHYSNDLTSFWSRT